MADYNIPCMSYQSVTTNPETAMATSPFTIGTNLVLVQNGLSQVSTFSYPNLASDQLTSNNSIATLENKSIDGVGVNQLSGIHQASVIRRFGDFNPQPNVSSGGSQGLMGCFAANTHAGSTFSNQWDATYGLFQRYNTAASSNAIGGMISPTVGVGIAAMNFPGRWVTRIRNNNTSSVRTYAGFTSNANACQAAGPWLGDTPLASGDSGLMMGYRSTDTQWMVFYNAGTGPMTSVGTGVLKDANFHLLLITWPQAGGQASFSVDLGTPVTITTGLPTTLTGMFCNVIGETTTTSSTTFDMKGPFFELQDCSQFI
jgi:hypothetical protein